MKAVVKSAVIGAIVGIASPVTLAIGNEFLFAQNKYQDIGSARICFADRRWSLSRIEITDAKGCKNELLDSVPLSLLIGVLGGSLIGALSLASKGTQSSNGSIPEPASPQPAKPASTEAVSEGSRQIPVTQPVATSTSKLQKPSILSISSQITGGLQHLKEVDLTTIWKGAVAVGAGVVVIGVTISILRPSLNTPGGERSVATNPFQREQRQVRVLQARSSKGYTDDPYMPSSLPVPNATEVCLRNDNSISQQGFDKFLSDGWKVVSSSASVDVATGVNAENPNASYYKVICKFTPYIIEK